MQTDSLMSKTRLFHYSVRLSVTLFHAREKLYSLPEKVNSVDTLLGASLLEKLVYSKGQLLTPQYINNDFCEHFIYFQLPNSFSLLAGPFLTEPMLEGSISNLIRLNNVPIRFKSVLSEHYRTLVHFDDNSHFYCGKLLECLFDGESIQDDEADTIESPSTDFPQSFFLNTYENRMQQFQHPPYFLEQEIVRLITAGDQQNSAKILSEINALNRAVLSKDPLRSLKNSLICSCTLFTRAAIAGGVIPDAAFTLSDTLIQNIESTNSMKQLDSLEVKMISAFVNLVKELNEARYSKVIREAITFINNNLGDRLTIESIANHVFVHPNYLSGLFKKETGSSITQYIQHRRVEEAKYFIKYSTSKLCEIANFYQFCSQSHFIKVFKQHTGITPCEYRRNNT